MAAEAPGTTRIAGRAKEGAGSGRIPKESMPQNEVTLRAMAPEDWVAVASIYAEGIATGNATFETDPPPWEAWNAGHLDYCRLTALADGHLAGWAALSPISGRCVYAGVAEVSVYVGRDFRGHGIGRRLLSELVTCSERNGIWTLQAGVFPENEASLRLHAACGFRAVGRRERIGRLAGIWRDVILLERRSPINPEE